MLDCGCFNNTTPCTGLPDLKRHFHSILTFPTKNDKMKTVYYTLPNESHLRNTLACLKQIESATKAEVVDLHQHISYLYDQVPEEYQSGNINIWMELLSVMDSKVKVMMMTKSAAKLDYKK